MRVDICFWVLQWEMLENYMKMYGFQYYCNSNNNFQLLHRSTKFLSCCQGRDRIFVIFQRQTCYWKIPLWRGKWQDIGTIFLSLYWSDTKVYIWKLQVCFWRDLRLNVCHFRWNLRNKKQPEIPLFCLPALTLLMNIWKFG